MINQAYLETIKLLHARLSSSNIEWYVVGKTNLALQGISIEPTRLGILIHDNDLSQFLEIFADFKKSDIVELPNGEAKEFIMSIGSINILVCAEYAHGIFWQVMAKPILFPVDNIPIPCFSLESEKRAYIKLGMMNKANLIGGFLGSS